MLYDPYHFHGLREKGKNNILENNIQLSMLKQPLQ